MSQFRIGEHYAENLKGLSTKEIEDNLEGICYAIQEGSYTKLLSKEELDERKNRLAEVSIELAKIEDKKKEYMEEIKFLMKEPTEVKKDMLDAIKHKSERTEGKLFLIDDQEDGMMYMFDNQGICVDMRAMLPGEKQQKIRTLNVSNGNQ